MLSNKIMARLRLLRWAVPLSLAVIVAIYQLGLARWIHLQFGDQYHTIAEILLYGTGGPLLAFFSLDFLIRWLEERETSELQSQILEETRSNFAASQKLNDETLQNLYAISILIDSMKSALPETHTDKAAMLLEAEGALNRTMNRLRAHLQDPRSSLIQQRNGSLVASSLDPSNQKQGEI